MKGSELPAEILHPGEQLPAPSGWPRKAAWFRKIYAVAQSVLRMEIVGFKMSITQANGIRFDPVGMSSGTGWRWAAAGIEYSTSALYTLSEIVIVSPSNPVVAQGVIPGLWIYCSTEAANTLPVWPLPAPLGLAARWFPISFYPQEIELCDSSTGEEIPTWSNSQPK